MKKIFDLVIASLLIFASLTACGSEYFDSSRESTSLNSSEIKENNNEHIKNPNVSADYLDNIKEIYPNYINASDIMKVNCSDYETVILFYTDESVADFRVFSLDLDIDESGNPNFIPTEVFRTAKLEKDIPIAVPLNFPGDMSLNGFSYKGNDENINTFTVGISGKDGSLVINKEYFELPEH